MVHRVVLVSAVAVLSALSSLSGADARQKCHSPKCAAATASSPFVPLVEFFKDPAGTVSKRANGVVDHAAEEGRKLLKEAAKTTKEAIGRAKREALGFSDAVEAKVNHVLRELVIWFAVSLFAVVILILALVALIFRVIVKRRDGGLRQPPSAEVIVLGQSDRTKKVPPGKPPQKRLAKAA